MFYLAVDKHDYVECVFQSFNALLFPQKKTSFPNKAETALLPKARCVRICYTLNIKPIFRHPAMIDWWRIVWTGFYQSLLYIKVIVFWKCEICRTWTHLSYTAFQKYSYFINVFILCPITVMCYTLKYLLLFFILQTNTRGAKICHKMPFILCCFVVFLTDKNVTWGCLELP